MVVHKISLQARCSDLAPRTFEYCRFVSSRPQFAACADARLDQMTLFCWILLILAETICSHYHQNSQRNQRPLNHYATDDLVSHTPDQVVTLHSTKTYYRSKTTTLTQTRYTVGQHTAMPYAVQIWHSRQQISFCDLAACASCRDWYKCWKEHSCWLVPNSMDKRNALLTTKSSQCETAPYCRCDLTTRPLA